MLYLISTPIGNLGDITFRAISTLKSCDYILCEDTRKSRILLDHYDIKKKLVSFHKFKEKTEEDNIIQDLIEGKDIALISDAGTPVISDPGEYLIKRCIKEKIKYTHIPGPCSLISAYVVSGINAEKFQFIGFLPKKGSEKENFLKEAMYYPGATVCFDTPHRIIDTLKVINKLDGKRNIFIAREITKIFEYFLS